MSIIFAIILFSLLIFVHELGHFVAAKLSGVQVNEFALFMGPAIFKKQRGETLYSIRCIPIGGFCAMEGEDEASDNPRAFQKAAWWKRLIILVAGSFMNLIAGILLFAIVIAPTKQVAQPVIAEFTDCCIFNHAQALQVGDEILELDGEKIYLNNDISLVLTLNDTPNHDVVVRRNGEILTFQNLAMGHTCVNENGEEYLHYGFTFGVAKDLTFPGKLDYLGRLTLDNVRNVRLSLQMLLTGKAGLSDMAGPVGVVGIMSDAANAADNWVDGLMNMLYFGGFIAINLGVMNMLPIPALDGGRVFFLLVTTAFEKITRRKVNPKYEGYIHAAGMIVLLAFMAFIMFKDIFTIVKG